MALDMGRRTQVVLIVLSLAALVLLALLPLIQQALSNLSIPSGIPGLSRQAVASCAAIPMREWPCRVLSSEAARLARKLR